VRAVMRGWHSQFKLDEDPRLDVTDHAELVKALKTLAYLGVRNSTPGADDEGTS